MSQAAINSKRTAGSAQIISLDPVVTGFSAEEIELYNRRNVERAAAQRPLISAQQFIEVRRLGLAALALMEAEKQYLEAYAVLYSKEKADELEYAMSTNHRAVCKVQEKHERDAAKERRH